jgi:hypothetical protein
LFAALAESKQKTETTTKADIEAGKSDAEMIIKCTKEITRTGVLPLRNSFLPLLDETLNLFKLKDLLKCIRNALTNGMRMLNSCQEQKVRDMTRSRLRDYENVPLQWAPSM